MLLYYLLVCLSLSSSCTSFSLTVPLYGFMNTSLNHPNGSLNSVNLERHVRRRQCRYLLATKLHHCRNDIPLTSFSRRRPGEVRIDMNDVGAAAVGQAQIGDHSVAVVFDTTARNSVIDASAYDPTQSAGARYVGDQYLGQLPDGRFTEVMHWNDLVSIAGIGVRTTFGRSQDRIFDSSMTAAKGIFAFSRFDPSARRPEPLIFAMQRAHLLDQPVFCFTLARTGGAGSASQRIGSLLIGRSDTSAYSGRLRYTQVETGPPYNDLWAVRGDVNGYRSVMINVFYQLGLVMEEFDGALIAKYLCRRPPRIQLRIGTRLIPLRSESLHFSVESDRLCRLSIIGADQEYVTLGRPFFESAYTMFDLRGRVGLGRI
ncbi:hypothetical protein V8E36_001680 [Tilletia maclaganii]